jgi:hypothetical protein
MMMVSRINKVCFICHTYLPLKADCILLLLDSAVYDGAASEATHSVNDNQHHRFDDNNEHDTKNDDSPGDEDNDSVLRG